MIGYDEAAEEAEGLDEVEHDMHRPSISHTVHAFPLFPEGFHS